MSITRGVFITNSYFGDNAYISNGGRIEIYGADIAPNVFIGSYHHALFPEKDDSAMKQFTIIIKEGCEVER